MDRAGTTRARPGRWIALALLVFVCACQAVFGFLEAGDAGPRFPHAVHLEEMDCSDCHDGSEDRADAGYPATTRGCMLCHEELDEGKDPDRTVAAFVENDVPIWAGRENAYAGEVVFDHAAHYEAEVDCEACHGPQTDSGDVDLRIRGGKNACMDCHATTERGNDCAVCHRSLRVDVAPGDHDAMWGRAHGAHSRTMLTGTGETTCAQCHEDQSCTKCHLEEPPLDHTNFWRRRGHGLTAAIDRSKCTVCHQTDGCVRCHQTTEPMSHRGAFGPPTNRHCVSCHLSGAGQGCAVCHQSFPVHPQGERLPMNAAHMAASSPGDCLTCHVGLPHFNPGGDCRACHQ